METVKFLINIFYLSLYIYIYCHEVRALLLPPYLIFSCAYLCAILSPLPAVLGMQPPLPPEAVRELVCSCLHRDPVAADLRCSLFVAAAQNYKRDSLLRPFPPRYITGDNKDFEELVRKSDGKKPSIVAFMLSCQALT